MRLAISGQVQGVGFRPFVYRLATRYGLDGWVVNTPDGVTLDIEGNNGCLAEFQQQLSLHCPPAARIATIRAEPRPLQAESGGFTLKTSLTGTDATGWLLPDLAPCPRCVAELFDPTNRRYGYPFISCSDCGPRWSLVTGLPFDRERTTLAGFRLCATCEAEYRSPDDRRFHAQTQGCPACGPRLTLTDAAGRPLAQADEALAQACRWLQQGKILAVKGIGGYQLLVDATRQDAVMALRARKSRPAKPFAILCASSEAAACRAVLGDTERRILESPAAPIVLLHTRPTEPSPAPLAPALTLGIPLIGILLPPSPLHHLLSRATGLPLVVTSGNRGGEPLCTDDADALERLAGLADGFLRHDRPIQRALDDSVVRVVADELLMLRRARGYSPCVPLPHPLPPRIALGGHLKNTVALSRGDHALLSQHLGDLDNAATEAHAEATLADLAGLSGLTDAEVVCDLHPDYGSSQTGRWSTPPRRVLHHEAHLRACLVEHSPTYPVLGVAFDGLGLGSDGTLWGGEFFIVQPTHCERIASLRRFQLPGGTRAVREPRRVACALLYALWGDRLLERNDIPSLAALSEAELGNLIRMMEAGLNSPFCSSVGRLYDAVASLLGICQINRYEGEAALRLECAAFAATEFEPYPFSLQANPAGNPPCLIDWEPLLLALLQDRPPYRFGPPAARFQQTLIEIIDAVAATTGLKTLALSGGVFQNAWLTRRAVTWLEPRGYRLLRHRLIPPNDGGLAVGQLLSGPNDLRDPH